MNYLKEPAERLSKIGEKYKLAVTGAACAVADAYRQGKRKNLCAGIYAAAAESLSRGVPLLYLLAAVLLSGARVTLGIYPMGAAFLAAAGHHLPWAFAGALLSAVISSPSPFMDVSVYVLIFALRRLLAAFSEAERRIFDFEDSLRIKMAVSVVGAAALGAYRAIGDGFTLTALCAFLLYASLTPTLTFLYSAVVSKGNDSATALYKEAGAAALAVSLILSVRGISLFSCSLAVAAASVLTVTVTRRYGLLKGVLFGLFAGLSVTAELMPIFSVAAVVSGILFSSSPALAIGASALASASWAVYAGGYATVAHTVPAIFAGCGALAFLLRADALLPPHAEKDASQLPPGAALLAERLRYTDTTGRITAKRDAFTGLSDMLFRLSDRLRRPSFYDVKDAAAEARNLVCEDCEIKDSCAKNCPDAHTALTKRLYENGNLTSSDISEAGLDSCLYPDELADAANECYAQTLRRLIDTDKTEIMAYDYSAISAILSDILRERDCDYEINNALSAAFSAKLREEKIKADRVCVFGGRRKTVYVAGLKLSGLHVGEDDLRRLAGEVCNGEFTSPEFEIKGSEVNAILRSTVSYSLRFEKRQLTKDESSASGDSALAFPCRDDRYCVFLSDGMGSGREAALTSGMCALFTEKMLASGSSPSVTLKMLNSMIRSRGIECSSTVDLLDFDLVTGQADFIKSGAAPSFIVRGRDVFKVDSQTIPLGIVRSLDAERTKVKAQAGDLIVMVSDGVADGESEPAWLYSLLSDVRDRRAADVADLIIREAERRMQKKDDATVCVIRVASQCDKTYTI